MNYTPIEIAALNPHGLDKGDRVVLPNGADDTITRLGFIYCRLAGHPPHKLADLRPYRPETIGKPRLEQLSLLD